MGRRDVIARGEKFSPLTPEERWQRLLGEARERKLERRQREEQERLNRRVGEKVEAALRAEALRQAERDAKRRVFGGEALLEELEGAPGGGGMSFANASGLQARSYTRAAQKHAKYPELPRQLLRAGRAEPSLVRFGLPPESGRSSAGKNRTKLAGVSVYSALRTSAGHYVLTADTEVLQTDMHWFHWHQGREAYEVKGREIGFGPDGEPILGPITSIRPIPRDRAILSDVPSRFLEVWNEQRGSLPLVETPKSNPFPFMHAVSEVLWRRVGKTTLLHGPAHWRRVAVAGLWLCDEEGGADPVVVFLFSLFHDSMREDDHHDPRHALRGEQLARGLRSRGAYDLDEERAALLDRAIREHDAGKTSRNPTIGVCWYADRLCLSRVGARPKVELLSTQAAREGPEMIDAARDLQRKNFGWESIARDYEALGEERGKRPPLHEEDEPVVRARYRPIRARPRDDG